MGPKQPHGVGFWSWVIYHLVGKEDPSSGQGSIDLHTGSKHCEHFPHGDLAFSGRRMHQLAWYIWHSINMEGTLIK